MPSFIFFTIEINMQRAAHVVGEEMEVVAA